MVTRKPADGRVDPARGGVGGGGSANTHKIRSAFSGIVPGKPLCMTLINYLLSFSGLCKRGSGGGGIRRELLTARHTHSRCQVLLGRDGFVTMNVNTHLVISNVAFSPNFMVKMASSHPVICFLVSWRSLDRLLFYIVVMFRPMLAGAGVKCSCVPLMTSPTPIFVSRSLLRSSELSKLIGTRCQLLQSQ